MEMKKYSVAVACSCADGEVRDVYMIDARSVEDAKSKAVMRAFAKLQGVTEISITDVREA